MTETGFSAEERDAMRTRAAELKESARSEKGRAAADRAVLAKIAKMPQADRSIGERLHAIITTAAPDLVPQLWYGQPAYAKDGKVLCFFQGSRKFKTRYSTLGFSDVAQLDEGSSWPTSFAIPELTSQDEERFAALVERAAR